MARGISANAKREIIKLHSDKAELHLLTIDHADLSQPIRLVNNNEDVVSNGNTFVAFNYRITFPVDDPDREPSVVLTVDNVDRAITDALLSISSPASVTIQTIISDDPDTIEIETSDLILRVADYNALEVSGTIAVDDILSQAFPAHQYTPTQFRSIL